VVEWQTHPAQNRRSARTYGFESHQPGGERFMQK